MCCLHVETVFHLSSVRGNARVTHTVLLLCLPPGQLGDRGGAPGGSCQHAGARQTGGLPAQEEEVAHEGVA